eukprot:TRINITY_DN101029_c0_g1_i1.p1 TRINITY_DN101029_c0_g1~~TRINITY_DN101029_c0_g1_i1.p1  ORF type:complete len:439 (-),score=17.75 TRINITY_DN101029_c0_g1_i1:589-1905(-)
METETRVSLAFEYEGVSAQQSTLSQRSTILAGRLIRLVHHPSSYAAKAMACAFLLQNLVFLLDDLLLFLEYLVTKTGEDATACTRWKEQGAELQCVHADKVFVVFRRWMIEQAAFMAGKCFGIACALLWLRGPRPASTTKHRRLFVALGASMIVAGSFVIYSTCTQNVFLQCGAWSRSFRSYDDIVAVDQDKCPPDSPGACFRTPRAYGHLDGPPGLFLLILTVVHDAFLVTLYSRYFAMVGEAVEIARRFYWMCLYDDGAPVHSFWQDLGRTRQNVQKEVVELSRRYSRGILCAVVYHGSLTLGTFLKVALNEERRQTQEHWAAYQVFRSVVSAVLITGLGWHMLGVTNCERYALLALGGRLSAAAPSYSRDEFSTAVATYNLLESRSADAPLAWHFGRSPITALTFRLFVALAILCQGAVWIQLKQAVVNLYTDWQ